MKKITLLTAIAMIAFTANSFAQATATGTSTAIVVTPIGITYDDVPLAFGNLAVVGAGTIELTPAGVRTEGGGVTLPNTAGDVSAAAFSVAGEGTYAYTLSLPGDSEVLLTDGVGTGVDMTVTAFTSSLGIGGNGALVAGASSFTVGATLNVGAGQEAGAYTGNFDVMVAYD